MKTLIRSARIHQSRMSKILEVLQNGLKNIKVYESNFMIRHDCLFLNKNIHLIFINEKFYLVEVNLFDISRHHQQGFVSAQNC